MIWEFYSVQNYTLATRAKVTQSLIKCNDLENL